MALSLSFVLSSSQRRTDDELRSMSSIMDVFEWMLWGDIAVETEHGVLQIVDVSIFEFLVNFLDALTVAAAWGLEESVMTTYQADLLLVRLTNEEVRMSRRDIELIASLPEAMRRVGFALQEAYALSIQRHGWLEDRADQAMNVLVARLRSMWFRGHGAA